MRFLRRAGEQPVSKRCQSVQVAISAYVDGELEGDEHVRARCRVEEHVKRCGCCAAILEQWTLDSLLLAVPESEVPAQPWFSQQFSKRLAGAQSATPAERLGQWWRRRPSETARWFVLRSLPVVVVVFGLMLGIGLRIQFQPRANAPALANGFTEFETIALTASGVRQRSMPPGGGFGFDDVLRPGNHSLSLAGSGIATPALFVAGQPQETVILSGLPEKDR